LAKATFSKLAFHLFSIGMGMEIRGF
jgi:hypothetical protein